jgi:hypothetical protein
MSLTKRTVKFGPEDSDTTHNLIHNQNGTYFCAVCYDTYGSLITDNICYLKKVQEFLFIKNR